MPSPDCAADARADELDADHERQRQEHASTARLCRTARRPAYRWRCPTDRRRRRRSPRPGRPGSERKGCVREKADVDARHGFDVESGDANVTGRVCGLLGSVIPATAHSRKPTHEHAACPLSFRSDRERRAGGPDDRLRPDISIRGAAASRCRRCAEPRNTTPAPHPSACPRWRRRRRGGTPTSGACACPAMRAMSPTGSSLRRQPRPAVHHRRQGRRPKCSLSMPHGRLERRRPRCSVWRAATIRCRASASVRSPTSGRKNEPPRPAASPPRWARTRRARTSSGSTTTMRSRCTASAPPIRPKPPAAPGHAQHRRQPHLLWLHQPARRLLRQGREAGFRGAQRHRLRAARDASRARGVRRRQRRPSTAPGPLR